MAEEDLPFLAFTWLGKIYINASMAFGSASSCKIFERVANVLQWIVTHVTQWDWISHYLDDFPMLAQTKPELFQQIDRYLALMEKVGMPVAEEKTLGPTQFLEYLGMLLNLLTLTLRIPEDKRLKNLERIDSLLQCHYKRTPTTIKKIQKLAGSLNFICTAIPAGKVFLNDLYRLTCSQDGKPHPSHHRRIPKKVCEDLLIFKSFLEDCGKEEFRSIPFMVKNQVYQHEIELYSDAAGSEDKGFGCVYKNAWAFGLWRHTSIFSQGITPNIALLELYALVMAVEIWAKDLQAKSIILRSDSEATVHSVNRMRSEVPAANQLLKHLALLCLHNQIYFKAIHISGSLNVLSDLLSRQKFQQFRSLHPTANRYPERLPENLWPPRWSAEDMQPPSKKL